MKFIGFFLLFICGLIATVLADSPAPQPPKEIEDPKIFAYGAGSPKDGYGVSVDARKNVWESDNKKHSFDVTGGYSQHLGGPYGNSRPDYRYGGVYTYRW